MIGKATTQSTYEVSANGIGKDINKNTKNSNNAIETQNTLLQSINTITFLP